MANTYSQVYLQFVFAVKGRQSLINHKHNDELQKYITGIVQNRKQKMLSINNVPDHLHMLVGFGTTLSISDFIEEVKSISSKFINEKGWIHGRFEWQRVTEFFHIRVRKSTMLSNIFKNNRNITNNSHSKKNISAFYESLRLNLTNGICLNGLKMIKPV
jgi:putative transposase